MIEQFLERGTLAKTHRRPFLIAVGCVFFLAVFILYSTMLPDFVFTDEVDIYSIGYTISMGGDVYKVNLSQHMPVSYYISAVFSLLGADTVYQYRLCFYALLSLMWTACFFHHRKHLDNLMLLCIPVFFLGQLMPVDLATSMLSDHWQGMGLVFILLELLRYEKTRTVPLSSAIWIALGVVLSFGTTFVSVYAIFAVFVGVALLQGWDMLRTPRCLETRKALGRRLFREDMRLILIALLPFAVLIGWYALSGNLENFYNGAYRINAEVYSKYINGFGSDPGGAFIGCFTSFYHTFITAVTHLGEGFWAHGGTILRYISLFACCIMLCRKNVLVALTVLLTAIMSGVRVFTGFHAMPFFCIGALTMAYCFSAYVNGMVQKKWRLRGAAALICSLIVLIPLALKLPSLRYFPLRLSFSSETEVGHYVQMLTDPDDHIHDISLSGFCLSMSCQRRVDFGAASSVPWMYEVYGAKELETLESEQTKIIAYSGDHEVWGYHLSDYAADLVAYIDENYTCIYPEIYVRNSYLPEAYERLRANGYGLIGTYINEGSLLGEEIAPGAVISQTFMADTDHISAVLIKLATYYDINPGGVTAELLDMSGQLLSQGYLAASSIHDHQYSRCVLDAEVVPGQIYEVRFTFDAAAKKTRLCPYYTNQNTADDAIYAVVNGEKQSYCLNMQVEYTLDSMLAE